MRKLLFILLPIICCINASASYTDHRNHNVDSLETVMADWTAAELDSAGETDLRKVVKDLDELMYGFLNTNGVKSEYYARIMLDIARRMQWPDRECAAAKIIGQHFWHKELYDSAAFYYNIALDAVERIPMSEQTDRDDALSSMYGTLGNLYSMMDSIGLAMEYYVKAGAIFKKHGWNESNATLYYNMGETLRNEEEYRDAEKYYLESLKYSKLADDSLAIATACKGLGSLYLDLRQTSKAMRYLADANLYFADHEDEELQFRMESLDYTEQVRALQNKRLISLIVLLAVSIAMTAILLVVSRKLKKAKKDNKELSEILEETVEVISPVSEHKDITLKPREKEILDLIAKGYTNAEIAAALNLSPETIKWYKKKLFAMFDAANSADLVRITTMKKIICTILTLLLTSMVTSYAQDSRMRMDKWSTALHYVPTVADAALPLLGAKADRDYVNVLLTIGGAQVTDIILTQACKYAFKEVRPDGSDSQSFFSGHTSRAFVGAEVIRMEFGPGWGAGAYAVATATGVLRVASDKHYWWDCAAGAGVGIACAHIGDCLQPTFRRWWNGIFGCPADIAFTPTVDPLSGVPCASVSICF